MYLFRENKISEHCHGGAKGHEVGDRFYDISGVGLPSQAGQELKLDPHSCQSRQRQECGPPLGQSIQLVHFQNYQIRNITSITFTALEFSSN